MELRLRRARHDRWLLGVCGGIAHTYGLNAAGVRLVAVILAIAIPGASVFPTFVSYIVLGLLLRPSKEF